MAARSESSRSPRIRDRVVQGALKCVLEPIFEADFQPGSFGYRPKKSAHQAVDRVTAAIRQNKTRVIDLDLRAYFDHVRHDLLLAKVARRVNDRDVLALLKQMLKASGKMGVPQGGVISPLLSNLYLTEVDRMLERAKEATRSTSTRRWSTPGSPTIWSSCWTPTPAMRGCSTQCTNGSARSWRASRSRSMKRKAELVDLAKGETVGLPGLHHPARPVTARRLVAAANAPAEEADGAAAEAQGGLSALPSLSRWPG